MVSSIHRKLQPWIESKGLLTYFHTELLGNVFVLHTFSPTPTNSCSTARSRWMAAGVLGFCYCN
jgi:hypothetical protein